jgi:hypothetical protein
MRVKVVATLWGILPRICEPILGPKHRGMLSQVQSGSRKLIEQSIKLDEGVTVDDGEESER